MNGNEKILSMDSFYEFKCPVIMVKPKPLKLLELKFLAYGYGL